MRAALLQAQPQLLHVAPAVVHGAVAPRPDAAEGAVSGRPPPRRDPQGPERQSPLGRGLLWRSALSPPPGLRQPSAHPSRSGSE